jgi:hypothetical protein
MADIHDQFDTILILDFGSQVRCLVQLQSVRAHTCNSIAISSQGDVVSSMYMLS